MGMNPRKNQRYQWGKYWRQQGHVTACLVEDCPAILDHGSLWSHAGGPLVMTHPTTGAALGIAFVQREGGRLHVTHEGDACTLDFARVPLRVGGYLEYFTCPACGQRATKLYKPAGASFACRQCHRLTYRARQKHRCYDEQAPVNPRAILGTWLQVNHQLQRMGYPAVKIPGYIQQAGEVLQDQWTEDDARQAEEEQRARSPKSG